MVLGLRCFPPMLPRVPGKGRQPAQQPGRPPPPSRLGPLRLWEERQGSQKRQHLVLALGRCGPPRLGKPGRELPAQLGVARLRGDRGPCRRLIAGHVAAPRERGIEHVHRPQGRAGQGAEAGPGPVPARGHRPHRRRRRQPRPGKAPAHAVLPAQGPAVHLRLGQHRNRRGGHHGRPRAHGSPAPARTAAPRKTRTSPRSPAC